MPAPASAAHALHDMIAAVQRGIPQSEGTSYHAWQRVSGHNVGTSDFARYHAEVVELVREVAESLRTLDDVPQRRYEAYLPAWWAAVVLPRRDWVAAGELLEESSLDMLGSLGDVLESRALTVGLPNPHAPEMLAKAVSFLMAEVEKEVTLPPTVREQVLADLRHVVWLLDNVSAFGVDHAVAATEKAAGSVLRAASVSRSLSLKKIAVGLFTALTLVNGATASVDETLTNVRHIFGVSADASPTTTDDVHDVVVQIYEVCVPKALTEAPRPRAIETLELSERVDAEIVEEK